MIRYPAAVRISDGEILYFATQDTENRHRLDDVVPGLSADQIRRVYSVAPDKRTQKDDGAGNLIAKPPDDIAAYDDAKADAEALQSIDSHRALKALALVVADLTGQTSAQIRTLFRTKYRSLG